MTFGTSGFPSKLGVLAGTSLQSLQLTVENESRVRIRISPKTENYFDFKKLQPLWVLSLQLEVSCHPATVIIYEVANLQEVMTAK